LQAVRYEFPLSGRAPSTHKVVRQQYYPSEGTLQKLLPGDALTLKVVLPPDAKKGLDRWALRLAMENTGENEVGLSLNGVATPVKAYNFTTERTLTGAKLVDAVNEMTFSVQGELSDGYQIDAVSLVLDTWAR
jgi:hypothetical protein